MRWLARLMPQPVYRREVLPGEGRGLWGGWLARGLTVALALTIVVGFFAVFLLPSLPLRIYQRITLSCDAPAVRSMCEEEATGASFLVQICGWDDVAFDIDQTQFRTRSESGELSEDDFSIRCHHTRVEREGGVVVRQRSDPYLDLRDARSVYEAWRAGEVTVAEARERLLGGP